MKHTDDVAVNVRTLMTKVILLASMLATLGACQTVQPWQRGVLARPDMQLDTDPLATSLANQVYASKEASSGSASPAGAGCGCN